MLQTMAKAARVEYVVERMAKNGVAVHRDLLCSWIRSERPNQFPTDGYVLAALKDAVSYGWIMRTRAGVYCISAHGSKVVR